MKELDNDLAKEILMILFYLEDKYINKIPKETYKLLVDKAADSNKEYYIDINKPLLKQNISEECKDFISILLYEESSDIIKEKLMNSWIGSSNYE